MPKSHRCKHLASAGPNCASRPGGKAANVVVSWALRPENEHLRPLDEALIALKSERNPPMNETEALPP